MAKTRCTGLLLTVCCILFVAGGEPFWQLRSRATEPPQASPGQGRLQGRFTAADTGKPVAGAKVKVLIQGLTDKAAMAETVSGADGSYALELPLGHCNLWGVSTPAGYHAQDSKTFGAILTTATEPRLVRDFVLQPGSPWRVELHGAALTGDKPSHFLALRDSGQQMVANGGPITGNGDLQGKAVLTIPPAGGRYRFTCTLADSPSRFEIPPANLEIDKDFDPRHIKGVLEPLAERKAVRLRDTAGRGAVVEGVDVAIEAGQAILRFQAKLLTPAAAFVLRGAAVDEAGKPIAGAKLTAAFARQRSANMSKLEATTDAQGKFEMSGVRLPESFFVPDFRISMIVVKPGYDGVQTKELNLLDVKKAGSGDFGIVVLKPGRTLRGKVVDEDARPVQGALVTNMTNHFLYSHLQCRTDAEGRFVMPDQSFGSQKIWTSYGERRGQAEFEFDANSGEPLIAVRLTPNSGRTDRPRVVKPVPQPQRDVAWDLEPPTKEPKYQHDPRYALLVFGPKRETRAWVVLDGTTLYVDRNANGNLTDPGERLGSNNPKDDSNQSANPGFHTHFDLFEFTMQGEAANGGKFVLWHLIRNEKFVPKTDLEKKWHTKLLELRQEDAILWRKEGLGQGQTRLVFMPNPADAQVCALDGPLTFVEKMQEHSVLKRGEAGCDVSFHIAVMGRPHRGAEHQFYNPLATKEVPDSAHLEVEIEYPAKVANAPPLRRKHLLKERC